LALEIDFSLLVLNRKSKVFKELFIQCVFHLDAGILELNYLMLNI